VGRTPASAPDPWSGSVTRSELVECVPHKVSVRPSGAALASSLTQSSTITPDAIVNDYDLGETIDDIREGYPALSTAAIQRLIEFAHSRRGQHQP